MENKINIKLVNQLKILFEFNNSELNEFYKGFEKIDIKTKEKLLIDFDQQIKNKKKNLTSFLTKIKIDSNKLEELKEKINTKEEDFNY